MVLRKAHECDDSTESLIFISGFGLSLASCQYVILVSLDHTNLPNKSVSNFYLSHKVSASLYHQALTEVLDQKVLWYNPS
jgi:hypothetical protein